MRKTEKKRGRKTAGVLGLCLGAGIAVSALLTQQTQTASMEKSLNDTDTRMAADSAQAPASEKETVVADGQGAADSQEASESREDSGAGYVTEGTQEYRGFVVDNVLHSQEEGEIHYSVYIPDTYDGSEAYALFLTLPGYEGLYFQGVGENLRQEDFAFTAQEYNPEMIVVALQLEDWGETSARQTIALTEYFLENYNIDKSRVYAEGYSGGGETMSLVMGMRPELFAAYLQVSSQWDGEYEPVTASRTPVYLAVGEDDEYYGSKPSREAYDALHSLYQESGLTEEEIDELLVLDVKDAAYFESREASNQHGGGGLFAHDPEIMGWLFDRQRKIDR